MGHTINKTDRYTLTHPNNSWDMNYHLIDHETGVDYLIDIEDVAVDLHEAELYSLGLVWEEFIKLSDIDEIIENSWKVLDSNGNDVTEKYKQLWY